MNDEKWQWVLEQCGLKYRAIEHKDRVYEGCLTDAQCNPLPYGYPPHDLNNIFKHVMPRVKEELSAMVFFYLLAGWTWEIVFEDKDPVDALLEACFKALGGKE